MVVPQQLDPDRLLPNGILNYERGTKRCLNICYAIAPVQIMRRCRAFRKVTGGDAPCARAFNALMYSRQPPRAASDLLLSLLREMNAVSAAQNVNWVCNVYEQYEADYVFDGHGH